tara:strand:- start:157 stop:1230 length:1074 start_codon:yes stop_codon:yes gene_type:complete
VIPSRENDYEVDPSAELTADFLNAIFGDIGLRLREREFLEASFASLKAQGIQAALDYIQVTVAPQLADLQEDIQTAQDQIETIVQDGVAPNSLKLEGHAAAYFATAAGLAAHVADLDNPHAITPAQIGTMTTLEIQTAIQTAVDLLVGGAPGALDTLNELAAALNDDEEYAATVTAALAAANTAIAARLPLAGGTMTGNLTQQSADPYNTMHKTGVAIWNRYIGADGAHVFSHQGTGHNVQLGAGGDLYASGIGWLSTVLAGKFGTPTHFSGGNPGYIRFANGFTIQWGSATADAISFPIAHSALGAVVVQPISTGFVSFNVHSQTAANFGVSRLFYSGGSTGGSAEGFFWFSVGIT